MRPIAALTERLVDGFDWIDSQMLSVTNPLLFRLRNAVRFRRGGYRESFDRGATPPESMRDWLDLERPTEMRRRYALDEDRGRLSPLSFATEILFADLLDRIIAGSRILGRALASGSLDALDVGSKNFECAPALARVLRRAEPPRRVRLTGIEVDAFRVYRSLHSRYDVAQYFLEVAAGTDGREHRFIAGDVLDHDERYDVVTWFKPFLFVEPLLRFGLPASALEPERVFGHVLDRLRPNGALVVVTQSEAEFDRQRDMIVAAGPPFEGHRARPDEASPLRYSGWFVIGTSPGVPRRSSS